MNAYKPLILFLLLIVFIGAAGQAMAQTACEWNSDCISWNYNALGGTPAGIESHLIETAKSPTGPWSTVATVAMPAMSYKRPSVEGTNYYRVSTKYAGIASPPSVVASSTTVPPAPTELKVVDNIVYNTGTFDPTAWLVKRNKVYGTIALGTECDEKRPAKDGYYRVPIALVKWTNPRAKTSFPLAKCERKA